MGLPGGGPGARRRPLVHGGLLLVAAIVVGCARAAEPGPDRVAAGRPGGAEAAPRAPEGADPPSIVDAPVSGPAAGEGTWSVGAALPVRIAEIAAAADGGEIYTGGGFRPDGSVSTWFGRYDVAADAWEARADMPLAVHHLGLAAAEGRIWLAGGYTGALNRLSASRRLDAYDPASDTWQAMADMPGRRAAHFLVPLDGRLYVVGGIGDAEDRMWVYDIAAGSWADHPGPTPREHLGAAASGGRVFVVAGRGFGRGNVGLLEAFDPATASWEARAQMPGVCGGCSAAATADGLIHVTGGEGGGRTWAEHFVYDPAADAWSTAADLPTPRHGIGAAAVGERFYVIGGGRRQGLDASEVVEWWSPAAPTPTASTPSPTAATPPPPTVTPTVADDDPCAHRCTLYAPFAARANV